MTCPTGLAEDSGIITLEEYQYTAEILREF
jgi:hypothetical protein